MSTFKFHVREGSILTRDVYGARTARLIGILTGFAPTSPATAMNEAIAAAITAGAPIYNAAFPGDSSQCQVLEITATPADQNWVLAFDYGRPGGAAVTQGDTNKLYVLSEQRTTVTVERIRFPHVNDGNPIYVGWKDPDNPEQQAISPKLARFRIQKPALQVNMVGTFDQKPSYGSPAKLIGDEQGKVNSTTYRNLARGMWLFAGAEVQRGPKQSRRTFSATLISMLDEDWSAYALVEHPSGVVPKLDLSDIGNEYPPADWPGSVSGGTAGKCYVAPAIAAEQREDGIVRIGPYPAVDFNAVFAAVDSEGE